MRLGLKLESIIIFGLFVTISIFSAELAWSAGEIEKVKLGVGQVPAGWKLVKEYNIPRQKIRPFETRFAAPIEEVLNQDFLVNEKTQLRLNYLAAATEQAVNTVYAGMIGLAGNKNVIVRKGNVAIEIISPDNGLKAKAVELLQLPSLQRRKLKSTDVSEQWRLVKEFFVAKPELEGFGKKFGAQLEGIINQFFIVSDQTVRINYIAGLTEQDAQAAYQKLTEQVGKVNMVLKKDNIVIEVIADSDELKKEAERVLNKI